MDKLVRPLIFFITITYAVLVFVVNIWHREKMFKLRLREVDLLQKRTSFIILFNIISIMIITFLCAF